MNKLSHLIICSVSAVSLIGCNQAQVTANNAPEYRTLQVVQLQNPNALMTKTFNGTVYSHEQAGLAFRVPGTIDQILVKTGQEVVKGQLIARLDPHDYQVTLEELQARKLEALSAHKLANSELRRVKQATKDDAIASVNLDRAISGYERSLSAIKVVDKNIQRANDMLKYTELRAAFDGVVASIEFEQYEQALPGIPVITLQDNKQLEVEVDVPENLIELFKIGQHGSVSWYDSSEFLDARVIEISPMPHLIKQTYAVTYALDYQNESVFPGKSVTVRTQNGDSDASYCVPYSAIVGQKETMFVNLVREEKVAQIPVELTSLDAYQACITGAMNSGDYVVVSGSNYLRDGDSASKLTIRNQ
ncbi:efflux RND transporter periplasmic adaptor subunit [Vibrio algarum]|uniref:Efflux RND transporter periplasmic adaptor subunit n=1 Tax=Vibrio algarum TaxID=3020714 RepID=A0ABT4YUD4_9VIBR|nr:efflux RND transporter periplasmic adaptor subunit [Vibrio sp. KJ40-1]MDB1125148.1 efflux RND transporter periplasmic adaptor subunit [Vibrio sp. KJ40-1]